MAAHVEGIPVEDPGEVLGHHAGDAPVLDGDGACSRESRSEVVVGDDDVARLNLLPKIGVESSIR